MRFAGFDFLLSLRSLRYCRPGCRSSHTPGWRRKTDWPRKSAHRQVQGKSSSALTAACRKRQATRHTVGIANSAQPAAPPRSQPLSSFTKARAIRAPSASARPAFRQARPAPPHLPPGHRPVLRKRAGHHQVVYEPARLAVPALDDSARDARLVRPATERSIDLLARRVSLPGQSAGSGQRRRRRQHIFDPGTCVPASASTSSAPSGAFRDLQPQDRAMRHR